LIARSAQLTAIWKFFIEPRFPVDQYPAKGDLSQSIRGFNELLKTESFDIFIVPQKRKRDRGTYTSRFSNAAALNLGSLHIVFFATLLC
jgi:hypothetical protein